MTKFILFNVFFLIIYILAEYHANNALKSLTENWNQLLKKAFFITYWSITIGTVLIFIIRSLGFQQNIPIYLRSILVGLFISLLFFKIVIF